jgi:hypothetical protein
MSSLRTFLAGLVVVAAITAAACSGSHGSAEWVASEIYVVDDRAWCMAVTDRLDGRQLSVCREDRGAVSCRLGGDPPQATTGSDCDAAIRAVEDWESESGST